jgi:hypothetical protein
MTDYLVTSNRLNGHTRGDIIKAADLGDLTSDILFLIESGHLSPLKATKSAKPIDTEQQE